MSPDGKAGETAVKMVDLNRIIKLWPGLILAALYVSTVIITGGSSYNLLIAGILIGVSVGICGLFDTRLKEAVRYMLLTGMVIGVVGVSPPLYFAVVHGMSSPTWLALSVICIILTVLTLIKTKSYVF